MTARTDRRKFLKTSALAAAGCLILKDGRSARSYQANQRLSIALVGVGRRGGWFMHIIPRLGQDLVAMCDVNRQRAAEALKKLPKAATYADFRKMLDETGRRIDAVVVATPDHNHAVVAAAAMNRGKNVYVEKPIAHDVAEARALRRIAGQRKVATQMGNQGMASDSFRRTLELVQAGAVGEIREVHVWYVFGGSGPRERPKDRPAVPEHLDWDLWLGPAPLRPYHPSYVSGWGAWRDFGTGCLGGGGSHSINMAFKALKLGELWRDTTDPKARIRVEAQVPEPCPENFPRWQTLRFDFPPRGSLPPVRMNWYNAPESQLRRLGVWQRLEKIAGRPLEWKAGWTPRSGSLLVGSKGVVHTNAHNSMCALLPESDFPKAGGPPKSLPHVDGHEQEWLAACKGGPAPLSNFDHSGPVIELLLLGNVATLVGEPLEFDPVACKIAGNDKADRALRPAHRKGWSL
ncbi:MAG: Gfo/Idh/MocA family oxidoreductase [Phycisphaerae bacterium]